jgi:hypothetical protein
MPKTPTEQSVGVFRLSRAPEPDCGPPAMFRPVRPSARAGSGAYARAMTTIYVDPSVSSAPNAVDQLRHFVDTGHDVSLVGDVAPSIAAELRVATIPAVPADAARGSWFVTADAATCAGHPPGVLTLLVGPRPAPTPRPAPRCDAEARDLASAVLEILRREAMG